MFALGVRYLLGRVQAAAWDDRAKPEWPPHPDRLFSALVAAFGETGEDAEEARALQWLETQEPPALSCDIGEENVSVRSPITSYVPVNDKSDPMSGGKPLAPMGSLPIGRSRQPRSFPAAVPATPEVFFLWRGTEVPTDLRPALDRVCAKVTYLGHSASPVQVWVDEHLHATTLEPTTGTAPYRLRIFRPGRLEYLRSRYKDQQRPQPGLWHGYTLPREPDDSASIHNSPFLDNLLVLRRIAGPRVGVLSVLQLATALRDTLLARHSHNPPEWLSGHQSDGSQSRRNRLALVPLTFAGHEHADGQLLGLALALPRDPADFPTAAINHLVCLLGQHNGYPALEINPGMPFVELWLRGNPTTAIGLELDSRPEEQRQTSLQSATWTTPACAWATVTPIVLDQFPRRGLSAEDVVRTACTRAGLPEPVAVRVGQAPFLRGLPTARTFPAMPHRPDKRPPRPTIHAVLEFPVRVRGPVLIGAGRYLGYGCCRPVCWEDQE